jgi:hypothetical protein
MLTFAQPSMAETPTPSQLMRVIEPVFHRYKGTCFSQAVSLGDPEKFRGALSRASIKVDPYYLQKKGLQGLAESGVFYGYTLYLKSEPSQVPPSQSSNSHFEMIPATETEELYDRTRIAF